MTSGGSLGNLTALLAARQAGAGFDLWEEGAHAGTPLCVLGSEEAHYSVGRALHVMGWGSDGYIPIPTDAGYRLRADLLEEGMDRARSLGRTVVGVVAHAGTTGTGSVDRLDEISAFCRKRGLWLHVDGAHGASVILSEKYRGLLSGIERADSVVWDAHKMMAIPALATGVVFRDGLTAYQAFSEKASYLFEGRREEEWFNLAHRTVECTKRTMSLKVYAALAVLGTRWFSDYVTATLDAARLFADMLDDAPDFATATSPETNIVCFRHLPDGLPGEDPAAVDAHQAAVRRRVLEDGGFYIVQTRLREALHLRVTLSHPDTSESDLRDLMDHIRQAGAL